MGEKFFNLVFFPCKRLYGTHASQIFLCNGRKHCVFLADIFIYRIKPALHKHCQAPAEGHCRKRYKRQLPADGKHAVQNERNMQHDLYDKHSHKAKCIPDFIHIILNPRHQLPGIGTVKIPCRQRLDMRE